MSTVARLPDERLPENKKSIEIVIEETSIEDIPLVKITIPATIQIGSELLFISKTIIEKILPTSNYCHIYDYDKRVHIYLVPAEALKVN